MKKPRIHIFVGHFGSGKTEVSINFAIQNKDSELKTILVDLDVINPYFRSSDAEEELKLYNIDVIKPAYVKTNIDVFALPAEVTSVIDNPQTFAVFDVGGDDMGAKALSRYKEDFDREGYELYFVINARRLLTSSVEGMCNILKTIESNSRLKVKKIINNTNLLESTNENDIMNSQKLVDEVCELTQTPLAYVSATSQFEKFIKETMQKPYLEIVRYTGASF